MFGRLSVPGRWRGAPLSRVGQRGRAGARATRRERREKERQQLADLVGKNLTYMSQLEGLDVQLYQARPRSFWQLLIINI